MVPERGGILPAARRVITRFRPSGERGGFPVLSAGAGLLALVAALPLAGPFKPVPPRHPQLLVAAHSLARSGWLLPAWGWSRGQLHPRPVLVLQPSSLG